MATNIEASLPPPPPPRAPPRPPPPMMHNNKTSAAPSPSPPPPPPRAPPRPPPPMMNNNKTSAAPSPLPPPPLDVNRTIKSAGVKLKPLYWNKVILPKAIEHSCTVWDMISTDGSINIDDDLMDALFPFKSNSDQNKATAFSNPNQISLLEHRKSQNIAIIIRSLDVTVLQVQESLTHCSKGLSLDTLEKLSQISLTKEEQTTILNFSDDVTKLADAESFLYSLLKSVSSPFERVNAMLFESIYSTEILHVKRCIEVLELACKEIKSHGLFNKLLEAVLKAGNRMNAGTTRGNARAFNLNVLYKLSDVKSTTDGKMSLLHFVVKEVLKSEGKLGLLVVRGGSEELRNVKEAAAVDYDSLMSLCSDLGGRMRDIKVFLSGCKNDDGFVREMKEFLEASEAELTVVLEEQTRVMEIVKRTTEYYQPGSSKDKNVQPLQLFVIVADFFVMFDKVCVDINRGICKR